MSTEPTSAESATGERAHGAGTLLSGLADRITARLGSETVYGPPVERDGVTVVPVASARFGFGAGRGSDPAKGQEGEGGGGGGAVTPAGYIELRDGRSRFVPVVDPARMLTLLCLALLAGLALARPMISRRRTSRWPGR